MSEKVTHYCDRCHREITYGNWWTARVRGRMKCEISLRWPGTLPIDIDVELCRDCARGLDDFLKGSGNNG